MALIFNFRKSSQFLVLAVREKLMRKEKTQRPRLVHFSTGLVSFIVCSTALFLYQSLIEVKSRPRRHEVPIKCIRPWNLPETDEGIGAQVMRHQIIFALAETFKANIQFFHRATSHNYSLSDFFDRCSELLPSCTLKESDLIIERCFPGDCRCIRKRLSRLADFLPSNCSLLQVDVDGSWHAEYSGCLRRTLQKYFSTSPRLVHHGYAIVHHRQGDVKSSNSIKLMKPRQLLAAVHFICATSTLHIIVLTEGSPYLPTCGSRVFLANDTTMYEAFNLFEHASTLVAGPSNFAHLLAQVSEAKRLILTDNAIGRYIWDGRPAVTILGNMGSLHHFSSIVEAVRMATLPGGLAIQKFGPGVNDFVRFNNWTSRSPSWRSINSSAGS